MTTGHEPGREPGHEPGREPDPSDADPLMAAITGEPVADELRADAAFLAEYESAAADVRLLRRHLGIVADELTAPPKPSPAAAPHALTARPSPSPRPHPRPRPRTRTRRLAFGALATAAAGCVLIGSAWLVTRAGDGGTMGASSDSGAKRAAGGADASSFSVCDARLLAEGDVRAVEELPGAAGQFRVTLRVTRAYRPAKGPAEVTFRTDGRDEPRPRVGLHVLVGIADHSAVPDLWVTGTRQIAQRWAELSDRRGGAPSTGTGCP